MSQPQNKGTAIQAGAPANKNSNASTAVKSGPPPQKPSGAPQASRRGILHRVPGAASLRSLFGGISPQKRAVLTWLGLGVVLGGLIAGAVVFLDFRPSRGELTDWNDPTPPRLNSRTPPADAPEGMVWIPGGEFWMGASPELAEESKDYLDSLPPHKVYVDGFWMDQHEVTNEEFARFVEATGYVTYCEKKPEVAPEDLHKVDKNLLEPWSFVFAGLKKGEVAQSPYDWWKPVNGANWRQPEGPGSTIKGREKHPVVHVAWVDAVEYCKWAKKRLPTEAEWEFAARGGLDRKKYCWGDEEKVNGKFLANYWQGDFPYENSKEDGHDKTAPVGSYPPNGYGLYDMVGNVWEWCADWYQSDYYKKSPFKNPQGPMRGYDANEPGVPKRVMRGGSFLCSEVYCRRYLPSARHKGEPVSAQNHCGFRCVKN